MRFGAFVFLISLSFPWPAIATVDQKHKVLYPKGTSLKHPYPVKVTYFAESYKPEQAGQDMAAKFIEKIIEVNQSAKVDEIAKLWVESEKSSLLKKLASNPGLLEKNSAFFQSIQSTQHLEKIYYGDYVLVKVQHIGAALPQGVLDKVYPLKVLNKDTLRLTNQLSDDPVFVHIVDFLDDQ